MNIVRSPRWRRASTLFRSGGRFALLAAAALVVLALVSPAVSAEKLVVLVRHAEKQKGDDPALTPEGEQRARDLAAELADAHIDYIISTHFRRCLLTAAPYADAHGIQPIVVSPEGGVATHVQDVADRIAHLPDGAAVLVVGHSNTIPHIATALGGPKLTDMQHDEYDTMYIVHIPDHASPRMIRTHFGAPDPVADP